MLETEASSPVTDNYAAGGGGFKGRLKNFIEWLMPDSYWRLLGCSALAPSGVAET